MLENPVGLIQELGVPLATLIAIGYGAWTLIKWLQQTLLAKINDAIAIVDEHEQSTKDILVQLINRIRQLQTDLIRLDTLFRTMYNLRPDERRINRKDNED